MQFSSCPNCVTIQHGYEWGGVEKHTQLTVQDRQCVIVRFVMLLAQPMGDLHRDAEVIHNGWYDVLCKEQVQYYDICAMKASTPFKQCK
jgi:hypothetical protein